MTLITNLPTCSEKTSADLIFDRPKVEHDGFVINTDKQNMDLVMFFFSLLILTNHPRNLISTFTNCAFQKASDIFLKFGDGFGWFCSSLVQAVWQSTLAGHY